MFGTLKPHHCNLGRKQSGAYATFYCGLCKSLGDGYGTLSRVLTSHDSVFIALLADGLQDGGAKPDRCRCPMLPVVHRPTVEPSSNAMRFARAVQMLLGDQWLADRAVDGKRLAKVARPLARRWVDAAKEDLTALGIDIAPLSNFEEIQKRHEVVGIDPDVDPAYPTALALGYLFEQLAALPGATTRAQTPKNRAALQQLGHATGRVIYYVDALDDIETDYLRGDFNPCFRWALARGERVLTIDEKAVRETARKLRRALSDIRDAFAHVALSRHRSLLKNILVDQLPIQARQVIGFARKKAEEAERDRLMAYLMLPWHQKATHQFMVFIAFLFSMFGGLRSAFAQASGSSTSSEPSSGAPEGGDDADSDDEPDSNDDEDDGVEGDPEDAAEDGGDKGSSKTGKDDDDDEGDDDDDDDEGDDDEGDGDGDGIGDGKTHKGPGAGGWNPCDKILDACCGGPLDTCCKKCCDPQMCCDKTCSKNCCPCSDCGKCCDPKCCDCNGCCKGGGGGNCCNC